MMSGRHSEPLEKATFPLMLHSRGHRHQFLYQNELGRKITYSFLTGSGVLSPHLWLMVEYAFWTGSSVLTNKLGLMVEQMCGIQPETLFAHVLNRMPSVATSDTENTVCGTEKLFSPYTVGKITDFLPLLKVS